jgi:MFS family permease
LNDHNLVSLNENRQRKFYYGYTIVSVSFLILLLSWGAQYSFGVFFKPVLNEFGWSRAATSGAYSLNMALTGIAGILAGRLSDRFGPRPVLTVCGLLLGLGFVLMSRVSEIWHIYFFYGVLAGAGMGGTFVPLMSTVTRWFVKRRGLASGIVVSGIGFGMFVLPLLANFLISSYSWKTSYAILGFITMGLMVTTAQFLRRAPTQSALLAREAKTVLADNANLQSQGRTFREAVRTRQFWTIIVMSLFFVFTLHTVLVHIVAHATDIGISAAAAATILSIIGVASIISKIIMGSLGDRIGNRRTMILVFLLTTLSFLWLLFAGKLWMLYVFAAVFGLGYGGFATTQSPMVADYFGLRAHGTILGLVGFATTSGGAIGALVAGSIFDISGSYQWAFILCVIFVIASLTLAISLKAARKDSILPLGDRR